MHSVPSLGSSFTGRSGSRFPALALGAAVALGPAGAPVQPAPEAPVLAPAARLPFLDLASGLRFPGPGTVEREERPTDLRPEVLTGHGLACTLRWRQRPNTRAQLLTLRDGPTILRVDVTGRDELDLVLRGPVAECVVESLHPLPAAPGSWRSGCQRIAVDVRGVFPFAGDPLAEPGHRDGRGTEARFQAAFDAVQVPVWALGGPMTWDLLVTDPETHVVRRVTPAGQVSTFSGEPGQPGHRDSPGGRQRLAAWWRRETLPGPAFRGPTYLARRTGVGETGWEVLLADSGNHVIRKLDSAGRVDTVAGTPGQAGYHDCPRPREALFNDPRGIAVDAEGDVYVADRGNQVIRRLCPRQGVSTVAGSPGLAGSADGIGASARFRDLRGLAWKPVRPLGGVLFALDGHAVRAISLPEGVVATVLGQVDTPGFRDFRFAERDADGLLRPCLRDPMGLRWMAGRLYLADAGNHAVRRLALGRKPSLHTLVGGPGDRETRWGLPRDGVPGPVGPEFAALEAPTALASGPGGPGAGLRICAGRALAQFRDRAQAREAVAVAELDFRISEPGRPAEVQFRVQVTDREGRSTIRAIRYWVVFRNPDGGLAARESGQGRSSELQMVRARLTGRGRAAVVVQCVTDQGMAAGREAELALPD